MESKAFAYTFQESPEDSEIFTKKMVESYTLGKAWVDAIQVKLEVGSMVWGVGRVWDLPIQPPPTHSQPLHTQPLPIHQPTHT